MLTVDSKLLKKKNALIYMAHCQVARNIASKRLFPKSEIFESYLINKNYLMLIEIKHSFAWVGISKLTVDMKSLLCLKNEMPTSSNATCKKLNQVHMVTLTFIPCQYEMNANDAARGIMRTTLLMCLFPPSGIYK